MFDGANLAYVPVLCEAVATYRAGMLPRVATNSVADCMKGCTRRSTVSVPDVGI